jgi:DNA-binding response OmpR family regulator
MTSHLPTMTKLIARTQHGLLPDIVSAPEESLALLSRRWQGEAGELRISASARRLNPRAGLIYEQNLVYRAILVRILERAGLVVEVLQQRSDLAEALSGAPGCIFIDCDDPGQHGFALAESIREQEHTDEHALLIAVTSSTSREQKRARKAVGFDNYLAKPLRQEAVRALLARNSLGDCVGAVSSLAIEQRALLELSELLDHNAEAVEQLYRQFLATASESLSAMRRFLEDEGTHQLAAQAQLLRSASGQIGAVRMQEICVGIQVLASGGLLSGVEALVQELALAFEQVSRELFSPAFVMRVREQGSTLPGSAGAGASRVAQPPGRLLLAESDALTARFLTGALQSAGFSVTVVNSGRAALDAVELLDFQALLVGAGLVGIDGYSVLSQVKLIPGKARTPVLLISGSNQEHDMLRAFDLGADEFIVKPLNPLEVVCRVKRFLR